MRSHYPYWKIHTVMSKKEFIEKWFAELNHDWLQDHLATDFVTEAKALLTEEYKKGYKDGRDDGDFECSQSAHRGGMTLSIRSSPPEEVK